MLKLQRGQIVSAKYNLEIQFKGKKRPTCSTIFKSLDIFLQYQSFFLVLHHYLSYTCSIGNISSNLLRPQLKALMFEWVFLIASQLKGGTSSLLTA